MSQKRIRNKLAPWLRKSLSITGSYFETWFENAALCRSVTVPVSCTHATVPNTKTYIISVDLCATWGNNEELHNAIATVLLMTKNLFGGLPICIGHRYPPSPPPPPGARMHQTITLTWLIQSTEKSVITSKRRTKKKNNASVTRRPKTSSIIATKSVQNI